MFHWVVDTSVSHWTLSWLKVPAMLTSSLNSPIHQSVHWLSICYVLSPWGLQPHSLDPTSPTRGSTENGRKRKPSRKYNKTRCHGVRTVRCLTHTGPLQQQERTRCDQIVPTWVCFCHWAQEQRGEHALHQEEEAAWKGATMHSLFSTLPLTWVICPLLRRGTKEPAELPSQYLWKD